MHLIDKMHFWINQLRYYKKNKKFIRANPHIKFPPSYKNRNNAFD